MRSPSVMLSPEHILQTGFGFRASHTLLSAVEVGLFTELGKGPRSNRQLRRSLRLSQSAVAELLEPLVALGFLEREGDDGGAVYVNSRESGHFLDRNSPGYLGDVLLHSARPQTQSQQSKALATGLLTIAALLLADRFDFSRYGTMLDLGSTRGLLARAIAGRHAHLCCTRLALPARQTVSVPPLPRTDVLVTPMILRRFAETDRGQLMKRAYQSLAPGGCLIAIELLTGEERRRGSVGSLAALLGSEAHRNRALSWSDLDEGCRAAGFERTELLPLIGPLTATLAHKPPKH
ncbi:methyltransferase family protein [Steroidobacter cummioxidans]|uniref:methyltransferase family protein n=1 Tax=Steroidobacter cummioxidans TaxID=1803913 RepID=UPI000E31ACCC|nr:methyltransferase dimerization domain-containing protein [Steroidobacter cummioxidans]